MSIDNRSIYGYVPRHFSLSSSVDLRGSMDRWDTQIGQKRPRDLLVHAHTGVVLALDWSPPSSSPATRRVELPEENVILGDSVTSIGAGGKEGMICGISAGKEGDGEGKRADC